MAKISGVVVSVANDRLVGTATVYLNTDRGSCEAVFYGSGCAEAVDHVIRPGNHICLEGALSINEDKHIYHMDPVAVSVAHNGGSRTLAIGYKNEFTPNTVWLGNG